MAMEPDGDVPTGFSHPQSAAAPIAAHAKFSEGDHPAGFFAIDEAVLEIEAPAAESGARIRRRVKIAKLTTNVYTALGAMPFT